MKKAIGWLLLLAPFVALFSILTAAMGVGAALFVFGLTAVLFACIAGGVFLITQE